MDTQSRKKKLIQLLLIIGAIALVVALVWIAFGNSLPELFRMLRNGDRSEIRRYLASRSQWKGIIATMVLAVLQVISIVFPGLAIQLASGVIYGWWQGFFICYIGFLIGNIGVFIAVRMLGNRISSLVGKQEERHAKSRLFRRLRTLNPTLMVALGYLLPLVPNGIIPYIAANSKISLRRFATALALTSWFQIFFNCLAGNFLIHGQYVLAILMFVIQGAMFVFVGWKGGLFGRHAARKTALENVADEQEDDPECNAANQ